MYFCSLLHCHKSVKVNYKYHRISQKVERYGLCFWSLPILQETKRTFTPSSFSLPTSTCVHFPSWRSLFLSDVSKALGCRPKQPSETPKDRRTQSKLSAKFWCSSPDEKAYRTETGPRLESHDWHVALCYSAGLYELCSRLFCTFGNPNTSKHSIP